MAIAAAGGGGAPLVVNALGLGLKDEEGKLGVVAVGGGELELGERDGEHGGRGGWGG